MSSITSISSSVCFLGLARWAGAALVATLLSACGGGGEDGDAGQSSPIITTQPTDVSAVEGTSVSLSVVATGSSPLQYQWSSSADGITFAPVAGATSSSHNTGDVTFAQNGTRYRVAVSNDIGTATSSVVRLTVTPLAVAPVITVQPAAQTVTAPTTATFNVTVTGTAPTYVWQMSADAGVTFTAVAGAPSAPTLAVADTTTAQTGQRYRVRVSNSAGTVDSASALLTVTPTPVAPTLTSTPTAQSVVAGQAATFTAAAAGIPAPALQWRLNGVDLVNGALAAGVCTGATVAGATTAILTLAAVPLGCSGALVSVVASNGALPNATSAAVALTVTPAMPPVITVQPAAQSVVTDAAAVFAVTATGPALTYQWKKNGANIVGATAATYTTPAVTYVDHGANYTVQVTNASGTLVSSGALLSLKLSANQQAFEDVIISGGGSFIFRWNLNYMGPPTAGVSFAASSRALRTVSPLTVGPLDSLQDPEVNLTATLPIVPAAPATRVLKNGVVLVVPEVPPRFRTSYTGSDVEVSQLADDNATVGFTQVRTNYVYVPLSGTVVSAPADLAHYHNSFWSNPSILNAATAFQSGAAYIKYTAVNKGDRYVVFDCAATTVDANVTPCQTGTTLMAAMTAGIASTRDQTTYVLADGALTTVGGLPMWIATVRRPQSVTLSTTTEYRVYYEKNGNIYTGSLVRDGEVLGSSYWVSNPGGATVLDRLTLLPFQIRLNKAARDSVAAAMQL